MRSSFKTKMLIYQSKANLGVKILFRNITRLIDPEIGKIMERGLHGTKTKRFSLYMLLSLESYNEFIYFQTYQS